MIESIYAQLTNGAIGHKNSLPWAGAAYKGITHIDMDYFKEVTENKHIVMGRKTWDSLKHRKLKNRKTHFIITSNPKSSDDEEIVYITLDDFIKYYSEHKDEKFVVIGGLMLYKALCPMCDIIHQSTFYIPKLENKEFDTVIDFDSIIDMTKFTRKWILSDCHKHDAIDIYTFIKKEN